MALPSLPGELASALPSLSTIVDKALTALFGQWASETRLYTLSAPSSERSLPADLMVESFALHEAVSEPFSLYINALVLNTHVELKQLYARPITLQTTLADGSRARRSGYVTEARSLEADGGFARKGLLVQPWIALLGHTLNSRVWQDQSVVEIVEDVFADHDTIAAWKWDDDVERYVAEGLFARNAGRRAYCVQYRETDLAFVQRLLAEEGICWRVEEAEAAPGGHTLVFFTNSSQQPEDAISASSLGGAGIRYHRSSSQEAQDSIQALGSMRQIGPTATAVQGWDYKANAAITADAPTAHDWGGNEATSLQSWLTSYDPTGDFVFGNNAEAQFAATRLQEAHEARYKTWLGRGTVRTLRAGTWFAVTQSTLDPLSAFGLSDDDKQFFVTRCDVVGINNLPKDLSHRIAQTLGEADLPALDNAAGGRDHIPVDRAALHQQAGQSGFACQFQALRRNVPWRAVLMDDTGLRPRPRPTALGPQTAIVVGPGGNVNASGADELYTDQLGRIKVKFHWQANAFAPQRANIDHSCWLRVMQRLAGPGMGHQFIPRIGQEVLVGFLGNDIDRPFVMAALYNGRGESGVPRTPGGQAAEADSAALAESTDLSPSSQMNLVGAGSGGHSPAWHGAAPNAATEGSEGQNNAAALSGVKSKEFGGSGYNQLVFDDTPGQLRTQLHSTQSQTWLQMGHLLHQADNHRGSFRGQGFELRTDAWGGLRAARGVMLSTFGLGNGLGQTSTPAGDNAPGMALAKQAQQLASTFHQAAGTHQTVGLATTAGSVGGNKSNLDDKAAPSAALSKSLSGMVSTSSLANAQADAADKATRTGQSKVPHMADPNIALVGKAGIGLTAGQDLHLSAQDTTQIASGQDTHFAVGGQARIHTGQAIGLLAGAIQPGSEAAGKGLTVIAAQGPIDMQAQAGPAQIAAKQELQLKTASGVVNIAAAKKVTLAVSGGASITIEGGSFTAQCPGKITVQAGQKSMVGGGTQNYTMPVMPNSETSWVSVEGLYDDAWGTSWPLDNLKIDVAGKTAIESASVRKEV
ncbi:MAG: type VI secretion system tip protein VgrG [Aquabacterium sp.]|uniref:type VI secretion system Vgr family protein n=1 Tax=Aquabacterium sp. TaxID=1872578 RepID=UPI0025C4098A|nr:type VI secretion system Vgr family protein [Aquabacterium sp.]MBI5926704.1 type VI secretion system tip protein VgrG [Aquabacterium sp.]